MQVRVLSPPPFFQIQFYLTVLEPSPTNKITYVPNAGYSLMGCGRKTGWPLRTTPHHALQRVLPVVFQHRQNIAGRVFEPGDLRARAAHYSAGICFEIG